MVLAELGGRVDSSSFFANRPNEALAISLYDLREATSATSRDACESRRGDACSESHLSLHGSSLRSERSKKEKIPGGSQVQMVDRAMRRLPSSAAAGLGMASARLPMLRYALPRLTCLGADATLNKRCFCSDCGCSEETIQRVVES